MADLRSSTPSTEERPPLDGLLVVDLSRLLPGAVLARQLLDLGARVLKVEEPGIGDPLRMVPPQVDGIGVAFGALLTGAESVCLDLRSPTDSERLLKLAHCADVLVESFRPGVVDDWGLGWDRLREVNPSLVMCSLSSFGEAPAVRDLVAHDLNLQAIAGALDLTTPVAVPAVQLADVGTGLLAASSILAALLARSQNRTGRRIVQPLASGVMPFVAWPWAEHAAGMPGVMTALLGGASPCYRIYHCQDGSPIAVAAIEPKFWIELLSVLDLSKLAEQAFAIGPDSASATAEIAAAFASRPRHEWLEIASHHALPLSAVNDIASARHDPMLDAAGLVRSTPTPGGALEHTAGTFAPSFGWSVSTPAPRLGEHTEAVLGELC